MRHVWLLASVLVLASCTTPEVKAVEGVVVDCAKAEGAAIANGSSALQVAIDVTAALVGAVAKGGLDAALPAVEELIGKYGEPIVACAVTKGAAAVGVHGLEEPPAHAKLATAVAAHYGWKTR